MIGKCVVTRKRKRSRMRENVEDKKEGVEMA